MLSGRDSLALFNQRISNAREQVEGIHHHLENISKRLAGIRQEKAAQYRELARVRLDDIEAGKIIDGLNGTDRAVLRAGIVKESREKTATAKGDYSRNQ